MSLKDAYKVGSAAGFYLRRDLGNASNLITRSLFEASGYDVYLNGYEITRPEICNAIKTNGNFTEIIKKYGLKDLDELEKIRSSPDLKVIDKKASLEHLVESKFVGKKLMDLEIASMDANIPNVISQKIQTPELFRIWNQDIGKYKRYWPETLMVFAFAHLKEYHCIYAKDISDQDKVRRADLPTIGKNFSYYNLSTKTKPLQHYFNEIPECLINLKLELINEVAKDFEKHKEKLSILNTELTRKSFFGNK